MALLDKVAHGECVTVCVTGSETLVSHVEEGEVLLLLSIIKTKNARMRTDGIQQMIKCMRWG